MNSILEFLGFISVILLCIGAVAFGVFVYLNTLEQKMRENGDNRTGNLYKLTHEAQKLDGVMGGVLRPEFVEWMMGYPIGWTDVSHSETQ